MHYRLTLALVLGGTTTFGTAAAQGPPAPPYDVCSDAQLISEGIFNWDNTPNTSSGFDGGLVSDSGLQDCAFVVEHDVFFLFTAPCCNTWTFDTSGSSMSDTVMQIHRGSDCGAVCIEGNDDAFGPGSHSVTQGVNLFAGEQVLIQVGSAALGDVGDGILNISGAAPCASSSIVQFGCQPASLHHQGGSVTLASSTPTTSCVFLPSVPVIGTGLHLEATGGPPGAFGFFLMAAGDSGWLSIFNGVLCLDTPMGRYNSLIATNQGLPQLDSVGRFDASGVLQNLVGTGTSTGGTGFDVPLELPFTPAGRLIQPGDTWAFQLWYRDLDSGGQPSANFSDSILAIF